MSAEAAAPLLAALREPLEANHDIVLTAPTGAGKSTLVPLALFEQTCRGADRILMLEPRRIAARAVAARMASLRSEALGATVGYRMRFDTRVSAATRIEVVTEGVLARLLQEDPALEGVRWLIFDECHERSLQSDLGLALALNARRVLGAGFRIVMMSATMQGDRLAALLERPAVVAVPGRQYPIDIRYVGRAAPRLPGAPGERRDAMERAVVGVVQEALHATAGSVLVFLPGAGEIRRVQALLPVSALPPDVDVLPLYGELPPAAQDAALAPGGRRVVLATNIAETSLTIPGVTAVVDAGLVRRSCFDPNTGMSRLELLRVARSEADQRAGRAGRTAPGCCWRLWSEEAHGRLGLSAPPEIQEADLAPLLLEIMCWGVRTPEELEWIDVPPRAHVEQARELLGRLGALEAHGAVSTLGRQMARLPVHPRLAHLLLVAPPAHRGLAAKLAALLSERDALRARGGERDDADLRTRLRLFDGRGSEADLRQRLLRVAERMVAATQRADQTAVSADVREALAALAHDEATGALLALAYPDRLAMRRGERFVLATGRGARFAEPVPLQRAEFIVAVDVNDRDADAVIRLAAPIALATVERLFAEAIVTEERFGWEAKQGAVTARRTRRLDALLLEDQALPVSGGEAARAAMVAGIRQLGLEALPWDDGARQLRDRMQFVQSIGRTDVAEWPASDAASLLGTLEQWLAPYLDGITRRDHLARVPLVQALRARLIASQQRALEQLAPRELAMPTGSRVVIDYADPAAPSIEVRLQEVFGMRETPRVGGVPITFRLLSPARRPVQITRDLAGFWRGSYADVRKDLRGRYPKHFWPEDPLTAPPTRGVRRK